MGLKDCLISAVEQGEISHGEAQALADDFDQRFAQLRNGMSEDAARAKARQDMEAAYLAEAKEKRRRADLTEAARLRVKGHMQEYRDRSGAANVYEAALGLLSHYGFRAASSVRGRTEAIIAGAQRNMDEVMFAFSRKGLLGQRQNRAMMGDFVKELHGEASGDATAKGLARATTAVFEDLRQRFNAAGGAIGKLENFGLPHTHDRLRVKRAGREEWKATIKPLLDPDRMTNPVTGQPVGSGGLDAALDHVYDSIVSQNRANLTPSMMKRGAGSIASQRQDERFLTFRDAASWQAYHDRFGKGDVVQSVFNHINSMAGDIAAMEVLGPNPAAMVEYMKQAVTHEIGKREAGLPSLAPAAKLFPDSQAKVADWRIDSLWQALRGRPEVASGFAATTDTIRNVMTGVLLGKTVFLAASTDPFIARASRKLAGLPVTSTVGNMISMLSRQNRREIIRSGIIWNEYMHVMHDHMRFSGPAVGADWSRWIADRGVTWSGLQPLTVGRKLVEARAWQAHIADEAGKRFAQLDPRFRAALEGFGVDDATWEIWRKAKDPNGFVTQRQIEENGGAVQYLDMSGGALQSPAHVAEAKALEHRAAAEKLSEIITSWSERAVPEGTPNARSLVVGKTERGTFLGEFFAAFSQFKSFGLSFTALQLEGLFEMAAARGGGKGFRSGLGYFAPMAAMLTVGGAVYTQISALLDGKKPQDMKDPGFWASAMFTGGSFGLFGDFFKSTENRFGQSMLESLAGPTTAFVGDTAGLVTGPLFAATRSEQAHGVEKTFMQKWKPGRQLRTYLQRYTPYAASHWATRGVFNRLFLDNLQWLADPDADKSFKAKMRTAKQNGTPFFIAPGQFTPLHLRSRN